MSYYCSPYVNVPPSYTYPVYGYQPLTVVRQVGELSVQGLYDMIPDLTDYYVAEGFMMPTWPQDGSVAFPIYSMNTCGPV